MFLLYVLSLICVAFIDASKILVSVPTPSVSHQVVFYPLIKELIKRGHEVVFITTDPIYAKGKASANLTEINVHDISYKTWREQILNSKLGTGMKEDHFFQVSTIFSAMDKAFEMQILTTEVQDLIKKKTHFDLLIIEACVKSALSLSHVFKAPVILMSSFGSMQDDFDLVGAPKHPKLLYPYCVFQNVHNLSILQKIRELYHVYKIESFFSRLKKGQNKLVKRLFGPNTPSLEEMGDNVHMLFLNIYPIWEMNRPVPPNAIFIGGIHQKTRKDLPTDLKTYLDSSKNGVIYFSFGTNVSPSLLPPERIQMFVDTFSKLPYNVLWKWDKDVLPGKTDNIKIAKWFPQSDLLQHPNIKAFITQGGLQSFDEALTGGVPLIGIPILGDQWFNVERIAYLKIGVRLLMEELTEDKLVDAIETVIKDPSYRNNMIELREKIRDQPHSALERAVWWTEHVLRHKGAEHLRAPTANMSWADYLDLELMAVLALGAIVMVSIVGVGLWSLVGLVVNGLIVKKSKMD